MEITKVKVEQMAKLWTEVLRNEEVKKEKEEVKEKTNLLEEDIVDITKENQLAAAIPPKSLKEAAELLYNIKYQMLLDIDAIYKAQANIKPENLISIL
ncbi:MAG TPA: hypothetical protein PLD27_00085 [bacterium]|nr:hypothetical protein [bacterium]HPQ18082.1 hypothetical protein [bacterium]